MNLRAAGAEICLLVERGCNRFDKSDVTDLSACTAAEAT
jgi:hypothetical protein